MGFKIDNRAARQLWLQSQGLLSPPTGVLDVMKIVRELGFVQLDTIRNVTRAHHHIVWSRNQKYREPMLGQLLARDRAIFEHFTHDASVLPMEFYPVWKRQFRRLGEQVRRSSFHNSQMPAAGVEAIKARIKAEGPLSTRDFKSENTGNKEMWARPPHKKALDCLWYAGELATSHRKNFVKFYDLAERVILPDLLNADHSDEYQVNWLCRGALERIAFGTLGEIQRFWAALDAREVKGWSLRPSAAAVMVPVELEGADGAWTSAFAVDDIEKRLADLPAPSSRVRILNPFDPAVRDRARLARLFGFEYRNEMFVPALKRVWGYYVYPLLEGDRFIGRIELTADRKKGILSVQRLWKEAGTNWTPARAERLDAELARFAVLAGTQAVNWACCASPD